MPQVSVVIPTYNRAHIIARAIRSVLNQTYQDFEIIIIDDGSTDNTVDVVDSFHDMRILYTKQMPNQGVSAARNAGVRMASGKYIAFQDSDDESHPDRLEEQVRILDSTDCFIDIVYSDMCRINKYGRTTTFKSPNIGAKDIQLYPRCLNYLFKDIGIGSSMIKAECFSKVGFFDVDLQFFEEIDFFIRASKFYSFYHIEKKLLNYYEEEDSDNRFVKAISARKVILAKYFEDIKENKTYHSMHLFYIGNDLCYVGKMSEGIKYFYEAIVRDPFNIRCYCGLLLAMLGSASYRKVINFKNNISGR
jgi:glycosyltransferase involved in cell wall biosynthesis